MGDIDPEHRLKAQAPGHLPVGPVRVRVLVPEEDVPDLNGRAVSLANRQMNWRMLAKTSTGLIMDNKCNCHTVGSHPLENSWNQQSMVHCRPNGKRPHFESDIAKASRAVCRRCLVGSLNSFRTHRNRRRRRDVECGTIGRTQKFL